jgi:copper(I)-binding protein
MTARRDGVPARPPRRGRCPREGRRRLALALAASVTLLVSGCVYYPTIIDVGGTRIRPANGRIVLQGEVASFYVELESTGKFGDVLTSVTTTAAREARLVSGGGEPIPRFEIPGTTTVVFSAAGAHVVLSGLSRPLTPGETIIVTLVFEKVGLLGVVSLVQ